jgi:elongation factor 1 alpha-like protein
MKSLAIDDTPLPASKNLDVLSEYEKTNTKKSASFVVVGKFLDLVHPNRVPV